MTGIGRILPGLKRNEDRGRPSRIAAVRILQAFEPATGGVPVHVEALTTQLLERGHSVDVALARDVPELGARFERLGVRTIPIDLVPEIFAWRANRRAFSDLLAAFRGGSYDVVHLHGAKAGTLGRIAARLVHVPAAYSAHAFVYRSQHMRERRGQAARRRLTLGIEQVLGRLGSTVVCVSEDERRTALRDRIAASDRLRVAHYGVPLNGDVEPEKDLLELRGEGPLFGFMARLADQKGLPLLLDALCLLRDRGTLPRFAIVGSGPLQRWVEERIAAERLGERVQLRPFEPPVEPKLAAFDVYVLPSFWEALPIGLLEAMAAGLPVISTTVNGIPEAVEHGATGLLVSPDDAAGLARAIERLAADPTLRARMGSAGRRRCEERFTLSQMTDRIEAIYRDLVPG